MRQVHSTTRNPSTYLRIFILFILSAALGLFVPFFGNVSQNFLLNQVINVGILYAIILGFLMSITLNRRSAMEEYISLELNKIRRMYHLALHIARANPKLNSWFKKFSESLRNYSNFFKNHSFSDYETGSKLFRHVTYSIYSLPQNKTSFNGELYYALLDTAAEATYAREQILAKRQNRIGRFQWAVSIIIVLTFGAMIGFTTPYQFEARTITAFVTFAIFLPLILIYEYDGFNKRKRRYLADLYFKNIQGLEDLKVSSKKKK